MITAVIRSTACNSYWLQALSGTLAPACSCQALWCASKQCSLCWLLSKAGHFTLETCMMCALWLPLQVLRYWPKDAGRNKGDPWFAAVVTDYEEDTGAHILTYQFGTQKEEKERVSLALKQPSELRVSLLYMYMHNEGDSYSVYRLAACSFTPMPHSCQLRRNSEIISVSSAHVPDWLQLANRPQLVHTASGCV